MHAIRLHARGGPEALIFEDAPTPRPGQGEVLVRVHAAAVTPTELLWAPTWVTRAGEARPLPVIPGHEFSGEIAALGQGVTGVSVGDLGGHSSKGQKLHAKVKAVDDDLAAQPEAVVKFAEDAGMVERDLRTLKSVLER